MTEQSINWERLPLREAYKFGAENCLEEEASNIRNLVVEWDLSYSSNLRRGYIVELFRKHELWGKFIAQCWPNGNTTDGQTRIRRYLNIKQRYDDFLASGGKANQIDEEDDEEVSPDQEFAYETDLRDFLANNLRVIESGLTLFEDNRGYGIKYPISNGRIDILAKDRNDRLVVIELKVSRGRNPTIGQILYYMGWVDSNLPREQRSRGIIIAKDISDDLKMACQRVPDVSLYKYNLSVTTSRVYPM
jgi:hypothetical protein